MCASMLCQMDIEQDSRRFCYSQGVNKEQNLYRETAPGPCLTKTPTVHCRLGPSRDA
ncbi:hypothetical protein J6590_091350 [Homalodisca vitripennis]|nr:hypothetical protein J6590_091350 [Homalodisca vitripennis]